mmetsp:Transcript_12976/g.11485  ORF Transcript_12976/g.11485 Transcript_12976/m.11485 type:complete len:87 (+) Transcript_12976:126-386(+)
MGKSLFQTKRAESSPINSKLSLKVEISSLLQKAIKIREDSDEDLDQQQNDFFLQSQKKSSKNVEGKGLKKFSGTISMKDICSILNQ